MIARDVRQVLLPVREQDGKATLPSFPEFPRWRKASLSHLKHAGPEFPSLSS